MARPDEAKLFARESAADATLRTARASAAQDALELDADERRRAAEDAADERRRRKMGLQGVLPVERRRAAPGVDLQAFGLISVARIFDDVAAANAPPRLPPFATVAAMPPPFAAALPAEPPGYLKTTRATAKRASKAIARREAREARQGFAARAPPRGLGASVAPLHGS